MRSRNCSSDSRGAAATRPDEMVWAGTGKGISEKKFGGPCCMGRAARHVQYGQWGTDGAQGLLVARSADASSPDRGGREGMV
ncbi:hypothetical protein DSM19430T_14900 [Desulfovibrio psychrotolerans]|uniref:Uncharacterized protein n=1 Tax=Desulfovibrio psychrotolerans TaxID=415242 RepID=A0A7J0BSW5_9BACT|nr:hypothetical protein DSM19430T_14900 [Desulfovibrio psychrotolerans]